MSGNELGVTDLQERFKDNKERLLADLSDAITYKPDRERDMISFMRMYLKAEEPCERPPILENLRKCINGEEYPDPCEHPTYYTDADIAECSRILDDYLKNLPSCAGDEAAIKEQVKLAIEQINDINERCGHGLIDTWRREEFCGIIIEAAELMGAPPEKDMTYEYRMW